MKNITDVMLNPIRMRIIQALAVMQSMTTSEICVKLSDVPRTTLYRHIKILLDSDILSIVSEKKIRGSIERTLSLNAATITKQNTLENASQNAFAFLMNKYAAFNSYFNGKKPDPGKDKIFLNTTILMMSDDEFNQFLTEVKEVILKYSFDYSEDRKTRDFSIISAPGGEIY